MHHPIFDRDSYPFDRPEADALYEYLIRVMPTKKEILLTYERAGGIEADIEIDQGFRDAVKAVTDATPGFEQRIVGTTPVLDRRQLRSLVASMLQPGSQLSLLIVRGDPDSGKSHSRHIFQSAASERDATVGLPVRGSGRHRSGRYRGAVHCARRVRRGPEPR
ncbi:MAG: hypothetical protein ACLP0J_24440 [Solirubrobacteraceae bacterium]|jgi:hypothetical protein